MHLALKVLSEHTFQSQQKQLDKSVLIPVNRNSSLIMLLTLKNCSFSYVFILFNFILFNFILFIFRSVVSYTTSEIPLFSVAAIEAAPKLGIYDSLDSEVIQSYIEFSLASLLYYAMKEGACSEQSSRMTAMDNASKNAGKDLSRTSLALPQSDGICVMSDWLKSTLCSVAKIPLVLEYKLVCQSRSIEKTGKCRGISKS